MKVRRNIGLLGELEGWSPRAHRRASRGAHEHDRPRGRARSSAIRCSSPAVSSSESASAAPCSCVRRSCCSTSRFRGIDPFMRAEVHARVLDLVGPSPSRSCSSRTTCRRRGASPRGSSCSRTAHVLQSGRLEEVARSLRVNVADVARGAQVERPAHWRLAAAAGACGRRRAAGSGAPGPLLALARPSAPLLPSVPGAAPGRARRRRLATRPPEARTIVVGSKTFPESYLLAEIMAQLLEHAGLACQRRFGFGGTLLCYEALVARRHRRLSRIQRHDRRDDSQAPDLGRRRRASRARPSASG